MRIALALPALAALTVAAFAQPAPQQSPSERAFAQKLMAEISAGLQCGTQLITVGDQVAQLQKELADEKAKNAKPPTAPAK